jgi:putative aminopeptidase FrvX
MKDLIQKLTETYSPPGFEAPVRDVIRKEIKPYADQVKVDAMGNLVVRKGTRGKDGKRIMLAAHMDEIGLMVTHVDDNGFVRFTSLGYLRPDTLLSGRVHFADGTQGVVGTELNIGDGKLATLEQCYIDVGAASAGDCPVKIGDVATFERPFLDLGGRLVAKSMDDRLGCAVLIETLRQLKSSPHELYFIFTTQEEVHLAGARAAAFGVDPDLGLAVDVTLTGDTPKSRRMDIGLGKGPAIKIKDTGMIADPRIVAWMCATAEKKRIPYQREILEGGSTDAMVMQVSRAGVPVGCLSIPCRYVHTPSEMVDYGDVQASVKLLTALLSAPVGF